ncbi:hypothetical protein [Ferrimonas pelagia]|uniref:Uncharacterized protein n=1 Tax=Ferrimonas pelagia TaxID=1177826 RepID=A0ABP9EY61_9GAMM
MKRALGLVFGGLLGSLFGPLGVLIGGGFGFWVTGTGASAPSSEDDIGANDPFFSTSSTFSTLDMESAENDGMGNDISDINPVTGLPMMGGIGGIDAGGNFYGSGGSSSSDSMDFADMGTSDMNPATGLPMMGDGIGGIDVGGNPYGMDSSDSFSSGIDDSLSSGFDDSFGSSFDDSFGSSSFDNDW